MYEGANEANAAGQLLYDQEHHLSLTIQHGRSIVNKTFAYTQIIMNFFYVKLFFHLHRNLVSIDASPLTPTMGSGT